MISLADVEVMVGGGDRVEMPLPSGLWSAARAQLDVCLSASKSGPAVRDALDRRIWSVDGRVGPVTFYSRDILTQWPRGGRCYLVVRYAGTVIASGAVRLVVG